MRIFDGVTVTFTTIGKAVCDSRIGATTCATVTSELVTWPVIAHFNRLRATDSWLVIYSIIFGVVMTILMYSFAPDKSKRRGVLAWSTIGTAIGFVSGMLTSWPATLLAHGAEMSAQGWHLEYQHGGIRSVVEGSAYVSFGMLSWFVGALSGVLIFGIQMHSWKK